MTIWCVILILNSNTQAQVIRAEEGNRASAIISCYIVSPIGIMKVRDMNFGNIISGNAGSVVLSPEGGRPSVTGNVAMGSNVSTISTALFEVSDGSNNSPGTKRLFSGFTITLPSNEVILVNQEGKTMRVSNFTSTPSASGVGNFSNGIGVVTVGATLYVNTDQGLGNYVSSSPFPVTVNFY